MAILARPSFLMAIRLYLRTQVKPQSQDTGNSLEDVFAAEWESADIAGADKPRRLTISTIFCQYEDGLNWQTKVVQLLGALIWWKGLFRLIQLVVVTPDIVMPLFPPGGC